MTISPELLQKWYLALGQTGYANDLVLVHLIIAQDTLFEGTNLREDRAQRELKRFISIPPRLSKPGPKRRVIPRWTRRSHC